MYSLMEKIAITLKNLRTRVVSFALWLGAAKQILLVEFFDTNPL